MTGCFDPTCKRPFTDRENPDKFFYARLSEALPDTVVSHCMCGEHNRLWSQRKLLTLLAGRGKLR